MTIYKNKVLLVGNLGKDPEIKTAVSGSEYAFLTIATTEFFKDKDGKSDQKTHSVTVFTPHFVNLLKQYPKKGDIIYIEGSLATRERKDESGKTQYITGVVVKDFGHDVQFMNQSRAGETENESQ